MGGPQVTGGGGHEPDPDETGATETPQPSGGGGVDLKSSDVPET